MPEQTAATDGRRARRERNRAAVIDAVFELIGERDAAPAVDEIAERAGVSVSSVFRYFDSLDDLHEQTIERYFERFAPLFEVPAGGRSREARVASLVDARLDLYEAIAPIGRMARLRAAEQPRFARELVRVRRTMAEQVRRHLSPDLAGLTPARADDRVALVDSLTAFEAWDLLAGTHGRSRARVRRAWTAGITAILDAP